MPMIEFAMDGGKIKAIPTAEDYEPSELDVRAAKDAAKERRVLDQRWDARRLAFFRWGLANPNELDMMLDEVECAGILFPFEYEGK
jgi:hypothetical protein